MDDSTPTGPRYLAQEPIARVVVASLRCGVLLGHYDLGACAVLANHVRASTAEDLTIATAAIAQGIDGQAGESDLGPHGGDVLASRCAGSK